MMNSVISSGCFLLRVTGVAMELGQCAFVWLVCAHVFTPSL